jgi:uncharacterized membrane protein YidH (DUF202 family)
MADEPVTEELSEKKKRKLEEKAEKEEMSSERTLLAFERTLLAWVRTSTHLMTFGFAIYKLLEEKQHTVGEHPILKYVTPKAVGLVMITSGLIGLALAFEKKYSDPPEIWQAGKEKLLGTGYASGLCYYDPLPDYDNRRNIQ